jgi:hypothetical protein
MLDAQQQSHDKLRALADAQRSGNDELSAAFLRQGEQLVTKANAKADAYGLVDCGTKSAF